MDILKPNDLILIVSPSGSIEEKEIESTLNYIRDQSWNIELGKNIFNKYYFGYNYAGTQSERLSDLQWALDHPIAKAIWFSRGGYGAVHLLDKINLSKFKKTTKWIIGFSDITALLVHLNMNDLIGLHANLCKQNLKGQSPETYSTIKKIITEKSIYYKIISSKFNKEGEFKGILVGGNLSVLYSIISNKLIGFLKDKILFIEDVGENFYHIDRILMAMDRAGILKDLKGLVVGSFTNMNSKDNLDYELAFDSYAYKIINNIFYKYNYPQIYNFPAGHTYDNRALIMGAEILISAKKEYSFLEQNIVNY